jgi:hypothetical protein
VTEADQLQAIRNAIYAMVNALGAALPRTPEVVAALDALVQSDHDAASGGDQ